MNLGVLSFLLLTKISLFPLIRTIGLVLLAILAPFLLDINIVTMLSMILITIDK